MQVAKAQLIFKKATPSLNFIIGVIMAYIAMGFLFSMSFYIFRNHLPGKTAFRKSMAHSMFAIFIVLVPGAVGMIAFDYDGLFNLLTPYKIESYFIAFVDVVNFIVGGSVLAKLFRNDIYNIDSNNYPKKKIVISGFIGGLLFPLLMFALHILAERMMPLGLNIPANAREWYYIGLISPYILTGGLLPCFYFSVKETFIGSWINKVVQFFAVFFMGYWFMNFNFLIPFGYSVQTVLFYFAISIPSLFTVMILNGIIFRKPQGAVSFVSTNHESK
jgi:hypothetical protein